MVSIIDYIKYPSCHSVAVIDDNYLSDQLLIICRHCGYNYSGLLNWDRETGEKYGS
ncbi:hypothetical protein UACE39S_01010 [Ureibacillus acetophenoni]